MHTTEAIKTLQELLEKINSEDIDFPTWRNWANSSLKVVFPTSYESKQQNLLALKHEHSGITFGAEDNKKLKGIAIENAKGLLNVYIQELKVHGVEKTKKKDEESKIVSLIKNPVFWSVIFPAIGGSIYFGTTIGTIKYDSDKISLHEKNRALEDSIKSRDNVINFLRHNSDSALNILGRMPYNEMKLDTNEFRKVQTNIENAGAALYLNK
jgi:hypothetical protein